MEWIKVINDAIEFREKNLTEKIGLLEVARTSPGNSSTASIATSG